MSKKTKGIIAVVLCILILALTFSVAFILKKDKPKEENENQVVSSETASSIDIENIVPEEPEIEVKSSKSKTESDFIEPDETKADEILEESKRKDKTTSSSSVSVSVKQEVKQEPVNPSSEKQIAQADTSQSNTTAPTQSFEDGKQALADKTAKYLKEHNIDPKTAGETGELCPHCNKKIWNPDKYGSFIPGMPEDYENSGYCLGTCAISFE